MEWIMTKKQSKLRQSLKLIIKKINNLLNQQELEYWVLEKLQMDYLRILKDMVLV